MEACKASPSVEQVEINFQGWTATRARKTATFAELGLGESRLQHTALRVLNKPVLDV